MTPIFDAHYPADLARVGEIRAALRARLAASGVAEIHLERLVLVVDEVVSNAIEHGGTYRGSPEPIRVQVWLDGAVLHLAVDDLDTPGDVRDALERDLGGAIPGQPDVTSERGRGLFLIHTFLADLEVSAVDGRGMRLTGRLAESVE